LDPYGWAQFAVDGARIRACAGECTVLGLGYKSHAAGWYCGEVVNDYAHIRDWTTGVDGWVHESLVYYGCG
jgi:hypothetical protein